MQLRYCPGLLHKHRRRGSGISSLLLRSPHFRTQLLLQCCLVAAAVAVAAAGDVDLDAVQEVALRCPVEALVLLLVLLVALPLQAAFLAASLVVDNLQDDDTLPRDVPACGIGSICPCCAGSLFFDACIRCSTDIAHR